MLRRFIPPRDQPVSSLDIKQIPGLLRKHDLAPFPYTNGAEDVLSLGRYALTSLILIIINKIIEIYVLKPCQGVAVYDVRNGVAGFPFRHGLP